MDLQKFQSKHSTSNQSEVHKIKNTDREKGRVGQTHRNRNKQSIHFVKTTNKLRKNRKNKKHTQLTNCNLEQLHSPTRFCLDCESCYLLQRPLETSSVESTRQLGVWSLSFFLNQDYFQINTILCRSYLQYMLVVCFNHYLLQRRFFNLFLACLKDFFWGFNLCCNFLFY